MVGYSRYGSDKIVHFEDWVEEDIIIQYDDDTSYHRAKNIGAYIDEIITEHDEEDYGDSQIENSFTSRPFTAQPLTKPTTRTTTKKITTKSFAPSTTIKPSTSIKLIFTKATRSTKIRATTSTTTPSTTTLEITAPFDDANEETDENDITPESID